MDKAAIAERIKKIREYRNYTQEYMAGKLNIRQNTYSQIESGTNTIKPARLEIIARILKIPVNSLLNDDFELFNIDINNKNNNNKAIVDQRLILEMEKLIKVLQDEVQYMMQQNANLVHQNEILISTIKEMKC